MKRNGVLTCDDCPAPYGKDGWCDVVIPDEVWKKLDANLLCFRCMTKRLQKRKLDNVSVAITSGPYKDDNEYWRQRGWDAGYFVGSK